MFGWLRRLFGRSPKIIIRSTDGKKFLGYVQNRTYVTERDAKKHYFYKFGGYAISLDILERLRGADVKKVEIIEHRDGGIRVLTSTLPEWFEKSESYTYKGDCQRVLSDKFFEVFVPNFRREIWWM